jgi:exonuclease III
LDFCCVQETRYKGKGAKWLKSDGVQCKFIWSGCDDAGMAGVGVLVAEKWVEYVREVRYVNERLMIIRVTVGKQVLNLICVYATAGR